MAPSDRLTWPPQGSLRAYVDLSIAHWRVASYLRGATEDEPDPDPPADAAEPVGSADGLGGAGEPSRT
jgi:hypothetical protein